MTTTTIHQAVTGFRSLCAIARELVASGHDPETLVSWTRNGIPIFTADKPLRWWAERRVQEGDGFPHFVRYHPRSHPHKPAARPIRPSDVSPYPGPEGGAPAASRGAEGGQ